MWPDRLLDIVATTNKGYMVWQEVFDNGVKVTKGWQCGVSKVLHVLDLCSINIHCFCF